MGEYETKSPLEIARFQNIDPESFALSVSKNGRTLQPSIKHQYIKAIENYPATSRSVLNPIVLNMYALTVGVKSQI